jgi:hypothetical protein
MTPHEELLAEKLKTEGWTLLRHGWPDWACFKTDANGKIIAARFVEAKADDAAISAAQKQMFELFAHMGFPVEVIREPFYEQHNEQRQKEPIVFGQVPEAFQQIAKMMDEDGIGKSLDDDEGVAQ